LYAEFCTRFHYGPDGDVYIALWIHDELVTCCRPAIAEQIGEILVRHAREAGTYYDFRTPLDAEFKIGRDWAGTSLEGAPTPTIAEPVPILVVEEIQTVPPETAVASEATTNESYVDDF
jgi:hypothetical protein